MQGEGVIAGSQPMSAAVHITWHGAQIHFGDLPPYLNYGWEVGEGRCCGQKSEVAVGTWVALEPRRLLMAKIISDLCISRMKLRGLVPNSCIHVSVSDLYIPRIGLLIWLQQNKQTDRGIL
jgi:hypothetical protein